MLGEPLREQRMLVVSARRQRHQARPRRRRAAKQAMAWPRARDGGDTHLPHQSSCAAASSLTTRLSLGERPVLAPDSVASAPVDVMNEPFSYLIACSYSSVFVFVFHPQEALVCA